MGYYLIELLKMIKNGLRTHTGKLHKDLQRLQLLLNKGKILLTEITEILSIAAVAVMDEKYPLNSTDTLQLITNILTEFDITKFEAYEDLGGSSQEFDAKNDELSDQLHNEAQKEADEDEVVEVEVKVDDQRDAKKKLEGGFGNTFTVNTESVGKVLENLGIYDFFNLTNLEKCRAFLETVDDKDPDDEDPDEAHKLYDDNEIVIKDHIANTIYFMELKPHDKIYGELEENFLNLDFKNELRIDYEKKQNDIEGYDILCVAPYKAYSYNKDSLKVKLYEDKNLVMGKRKERDKSDIKFNTSRILTNKVSAKIAGDIFMSMCQGITDDPESIKYLSQFRYFGQYPDFYKKIPGLTEIFNPETGLTEKLDSKVICAMFLFSSVIRGLNPIKLVHQKKTFKKRVIGDVDIEGYTIQQILDLIEGKYSALDIQNKDYNFCYLAHSLIQFYRLVAEMAGIEGGDDVIFR